MFGIFGDLKDFLRKAAQTKLAFFLFCYLVIIPVNWLLLYLLWLSDDNLLLLSIGWPFYLAGILAELLAAQPVEHNGMVMPVHTNVFYGIMLIAFLGAMGYMAACGLRAENRRRGVWFVLLGLLAPANLAFFILTTS